MHPTSRGFRRQRIRRSFTSVALALGATFVLAGFAVQADGAERSDMQKAMAKMQALNQARGYLDAHAAIANPQPLLGGPLKVMITQDSGGVLIGLPDHRALDPTIFGPPKLPRHYSGTPIITGVPPALRVPAKGGGLQTKVLTPFGNKHIALPNGHLNIEAVDATATDAATTNDKVRFQASWQDPKGSTYEVVCCKKLAAHGLETPTFGGVATNVILHGFTGLGTPLMPSEFTYFAFWGFGEVRKDGKTLAKPRLIHGMLTEYVRKEGYALGWDRDVTPSRLHFHLMVVPMKPDPQHKVFVHDPVNTGFVLPNGKTLPFWHVMFENVNVQASRG